MGYSINAVSGTIAAAGTTSDAMDLGSVFKKVNLQVPTMASVANLQVLVSVDGGNYYQAFTKVHGTATVSINSFVIGTTAPANGGVLEIPGGFRFYKVRADSAPAVAAVFKLIGSND